MNHQPKHVAIIMDGNGRWAKKQGKKRFMGHNRGAKTVKTVVEEAARQGIENLTLFAFSTDNWNRPKHEVNLLMKLLVSSLKKEFKQLIDNNIRLCSVGHLESLPSPVKQELLFVIEKTKTNNGMILTLALNYGGKEEILEAVKSIALKVKNSIISPEKVDESTIIEHLYTRNLPPVDLLIRTSGEERISNFLLWHIAYSELYFTETLWPDFTKEDLQKALINYGKRERRFGKTSEQLTTQDPK
jgi:undecaprenyl diphosphate synthase